MYMKRQIAIGFYDELIGFDGIENKRLCFFENKKVGKNAGGSGNVIENKG